VLVYIVEAIVVQMDGVLEKMPILLTHLATKEKQRRVPITKAGVARVEVVEALVVAVQVEQVEVALVDVRLAGHVMERAQTAELLTCLMELGVTGNPSG
jgi:hypothetical protein